MTDPIVRLNAALSDRYRIERELGVGGMATVYLAEDQKHRRKVALKVLKPDLAAIVLAVRSADPGSDDARMTLNQQSRLRARVGEIHVVLNFFEELRGRVK